MVESKLGFLLPAVDTTLLENAADSESKRNPQMMKPKWVCTHKWSEFKFLMDPDLTNSQNPVFTPFKNSSPSYYTVIDTRDVSIMVAIKRSWLVTCSILGNTRLISKFGDYLKLGMRVMLLRDRHHLKCHWHPKRSSSPKNVIIG